MKVYIGPYLNLIGPYQIAEWIPFITEAQQFKIGQWLSNTWVNDLCEWIHSKQQRKIKIHIDDYDTWSMDHTLALIILPMLKQLKATKHGSCFINDEDVPSHMRHGDPGGYDNWVHYKWDWVLNEMIWAFEQKLDNDWEEQYTLQEGELDLSEHPEDEGKEYTELRWKKDFVIDWNGRNAHQERIVNGIRLFGKYYHGLWD